MVAFLLWDSQGDYTPAQINEAPGNSVIRGWKRVAEKQTSIPTPEFALTAPRGTKRVIKEL